MMYVLLIYMYSSSPSGVALQRIDGFLNIGACEIAKREVETINGSLNARCIRVR